ncbi:MAG: hypothetical protein A2900_05115 [Candidatus Chisholmbacteria bacterium RIFCSPLOWO2_01_FULL_50_28]|uniref:methionyl-tRNA formyltransferase n=1 Tax=Candidatus Chisholmbacteria bacterium RIFCSPHIGHO2_01_FULL_52_32 TaxID=1797591 RepID=A0A1G1VS15_9BACT|nr:MAG: hypothetical protein A2786_01625 [Candidatus Chisholmbacteria bacterium RIFCSPHIGHO2_01_FULL_52_32]OGY20428.1 MAG: hypothetical protein A2900_05115 [Candidatus Chisholmbacteria bacterium RIFCSPLOWO2_01_FULL_50_28]
MNRPFSLAFFGSSPNSVTVLKALLDARFPVKLVITAPPRPVGRRQILTKTPPHTFAKEHFIPVITPAPLRETPIKVLNLPQLDVAIVADYAQLIPKELLDYPKHGCLNLHPSLLPKFRGASPGEFAILTGEKETGMTIIRMDEQFDHGPIIAQFKEEIRADDTSKTLYQRLFSKGGEVLITILRSWVEGKITPRAQDHLRATYAPRLTRDDGFVPWKLIQQAMAGKLFAPNRLNQRLKEVFQQSEVDKFSPAATARPKAWQTQQKRKAIQDNPSAAKKISVGRADFLERAVRAFSPWPGIWTKVKVKSQKLKVKSEEKRMKILTAHLYPKPYTPAPPAGRLNPILILDQVQLEGKNPTSFSNIQNILSL